MQVNAARGSQKWLQLAVARAPHLLRSPDLPDLEWVSPLARDGFAEYMDGAFLDRIGHGHLKQALPDFWPRSGPRWDGLAVFGNGGAVLVEAKAHIGEFLSDPSAAKAAASITTIGTSLARAKAALGADERSDWSRTLYQYANRIAHLWWLREQGVDARLLLVGFLNDSDMAGPEHAETWHAAHAVANHALGLPSRHSLTPFILHVTPDVRAVPEG